MSNKKIFTWLDTYGRGKELWFNIFRISVVVCILLEISSSIIFKLTQNRQIFMIILFAVAILMIFSLVMWLLNYCLYEILLCKRAIKNNSIETLNNVNKNINIKNKHLTINYVLEGKYKNDKIYKTSEGLSLNTNYGYFTKSWISSYTVIDETNKDQYSFWKGALGVALIGGLGAVAGMENKKEYLIAIEWKDGEKSLISIDNEYYRVLVQSMF